MESKILRSNLLSRSPFRRWIRPALLLGLVALIIAQILLLSPSSVEESKNGAVVGIDPQTLVPKAKVTLAPGIPKDRVPEYTVQKFNYVSAQGSEKQWNLVASEAYLFNQEKLVHAREVTAYLFDPDGKTTVVKGSEAKYFMNKRDLEIFGNVRTIFPDGFEIDSEYLRYKPNEKFIDMPVEYLVHGHGNANGSDQNMSFVSNGLNYEMKKSKIILPKAVHVTVTKAKAPLKATGPASNPPAAEPPTGKNLGSDSTTIESDHCVIEKSEQIAHFTMYPSRPLKTRFVHVTQPTLFSRGRRADLNYGTTNQTLNYIVLYEDVLVKETGADSLRYATGSRADFDTQKNVIILTGYPQVYQNDDTVTGDVILMHRDTDIVEVEQSNAFSQGSSGSQ